MSRGPDAATLIERALIAQSRAAGCSMAVAAAESTRWSSATFVGARHLLRLSCVRSAALEAWLGGLAEADFVLRGHLVADLVIECVHRQGEAVTVSLEILTVEER